MNMADDEWSDDGIQVQTKPPQDPPSVKPAQNPFTTKAENQSKKVRFGKNSSAPGPSKSNFENGVEEEVKKQVARALHQQNDQKFSGSTDSRNNRRARSRSWVLKIAPFLIGNFAV